MKAYFKIMQNSAFYSKSLDCAESVYGQKGTHESFLVHMQVFLKREH